MPRALELRRVSAGYGETVVIEDIDLNLEKGECVSVIGRNGVGKCTIFAVPVLILSPVASIGRSPPDLPLLTTVLL